MTRARAFKRWYIAKPLLIAYVIVGAHVVSLCLLVEWAKDKAIEVLEWIFEIDDGD